MAEPHPVFILPNTFRNVVLKEVNQIYEIRSDISTIEDIKQWVSEFSEVNKASYVVRTTKNNTLKSKH